MIKKFLAIGLALILLIVTGCSDKEENKAKMVVPIKVGFNSIAPDTDYSAATKEVIRNMNAGLLKFNPDEGKLIPGLAEEYKVENSGKTYIFKLRDNVQFHNGKKITSEDVKYSFERISGINNGKPIIGDWNKSLESIEIIDDRTIKINIKAGREKSSDIYDIADVSIIPAGISEMDLEKHPIGAGPYQFEKYIPGQLLVLKAFENYYLGAPDIKEVEFKFYKEGAGRILSFKNGEIDFLPLTVETKKEISEQKDVEIVSNLGNDVNILYLNENTYAPFKEKKVRQAIWQGIDIDRIVNSISLPGAQRLGSHMSPYLKEYYQDGLDNKYPYNPEYAKKLLEEAGYKDRLSFTLTVIAENNFENDMALLIKEDLSKIGIDVTVNPIPWGQYLPEVYKGHKYQAAILRIAGYPDPYRILKRYETKYSSNMGEYSNIEVDELLSKAEKTYDEEEIRNIYKKIQTILNNDIAAIYLIDQGTAIALSPKFTGYKVYPYAFIDIYSIKLKQNYKK